MTLPADLPALKAHAANLSQSDSRADRDAAMRLYALIRRAEGREPENTCPAHLEPYRKHLEAERIKSQITAAMAAGNHRLADGLSDIYGGRLTSSLHPRNRITAH